MLGIAIVDHGLTASQVFSLSADMLLDEESLFKILRYGHSRIPVYEPGERVWRPCRICLSPVYVLAILTSDMLALK